MPPHAGITVLPVSLPKTRAGVQTATAVASAAQTLGLEYSGDFTYPFSPKGIADASPFIIEQVIATATGAIVLSADSDGGLSQLGQALSREGLDDARVKVLGTTRWDIPASNLSTPGAQFGVVYLARYLCHQHV